MKKRLLILLPISLLFMPQLPAQQAGIKSNVVYWATSTPNLGIEFDLGAKTTFDLAGGYNPWTLGGAASKKKIQHWIVRPEIRFWPDEKWNGHFWGVHALFTAYNAGGVNIPLLPLKNMKNNRYQGYGTGAGLSYGYQWYLGRQWNLELTAGLGYVYLNYERYECHKCGDLIEKTHKHWVGPTHIGISFIYLFKS